MMCRNLFKTTKASFFIAIILLYGLRMAPVRAQEEFPEGSLWRAKDDSRIYVISQGHKRHILNDAVLASYGWRVNDVQEADPDTLFALPDARVVKLATSTETYDIVSGLRQLIDSEEEFLDRGFTWDEVAIVNQAELESYSLVPPLEVPAESGASASGGLSLTGQAVESLLLKKIGEAREFLLQAPPSYPQEKLVLRTSVLRRGVIGGEVTALQGTLKKLGYFAQHVEVNGVFGPSTEKALKVFQRAQRLTQTGAVGPKTREALIRNGLALGAGAGSQVSQWKDSVPSERTVLLAAWNEELGAMELVRVVVGSKRIKAGKKTVTVPTVRSETPGFTVHYKSGSGINTNYTVISPPGYRVLANRFPIFDASKGLTTWPPKEEVYVPYGDELRTPEIVQAGRAYLDEAVTQALGALRQKGIQSLSGKGLVADFVDPDEMKNIALIEHIDHGEFRRTEDKHGVVNKVFTVLGANRDAAYRFSGSAKGALGLAQFIKSTYGIIRREYPVAHLIPDFQEGMANHVNAFQAMALYMDVSGATLESYARERIASTPEDLAFALAEMRAAAYNGGAGRVKKTVKLLGPQWSLSKQAAQNMLRGNIAAAKQRLRDISASLKKAVGDTKRALAEEKKTLDAKLKEYQKQLASVSAIVLRNETVGYLEKFRVVREILKSL